MVLETSEREPGFLDKWLQTWEQGIISQNSSFLRKKKKGFANISILQNI